MYLVDINILSATANLQTTTLAFPDLAAWVEATSARLWLSVVTIGEIEAGIERSRLKGDVRKATNLSAWLETTEHLYDQRILPIDRNIARRAGQLSARAAMAGTSPGFADAAIAATAETRGLIVLTRNAKDFRPFGVPFINPYEDGLPSLES